MCSNQSYSKQPKYQYKDGYDIKNDTAASTVASSVDDASDATSDTVISPQCEKFCPISGTKTPVTSKPSTGYICRSSSSGCGRR